MTKLASLTLRLDVDDLARLKEQHAQTYAAHRLSFNAWAVGRLMQPSKAKKDSRDIP